MGKSQLGVVSMLPLERQQNIFDLIKQNRSASVTELSKKFFIGEASIRRDLDKLEKKGLIKRTYGGAVLVSGLDSEIPLFIREEEQRGAKQIIGQLAASLVEDGNIIIMDSSSTVLSMVPHLSGKRDFIVITNGAKAAVELGEQLHVSLYCTGGKLRENSLSYIGEVARKTVELFYADRLFFSCRSLSMERGLSDISEEETELRRVMVESCKQVVLLCDSTKFDKNSFCKMFGFDKVHCVVTEKKPSAKWMEFFDAQGIRVMF
jgi:DeoR/GlpR family transcriptional regulator of sugar metabolism